MDTARQIFAAVSPLAIAIFALGCRAPAPVHGGTGRDQIHVAAFRSAGIDSAADCLAALPIVPRPLSEAFDLSRAPMKWFANLPVAHAESRSDRSPGFNAAPPLRDP